MKTWFSVCVFALLTACSGKRPETLGVVNNSLGDCPDKENCVSSFASQDKHKIEPLQIPGDQQESFSKIKQSIKDNFSRAELIKEEGSYMHYEFTTALMRYVDDVEFYWTEGGKIHIRSASRLGHSDFGVNRERMEKIRSGLPE